MVLDEPVELDVVEVLDEALDPLLEVDELLVDDGDARSPIAEDSEPPPLLQPAKTINTTASEQRWYLFNRPITSALMSRLTPLNHPAIRSNGQNISI